MRQVKVIGLCWAFYCYIESPVIGIVFHCKHNFSTFIYSKPESNIKNIDGKGVKCPGFAQVGVGGGGC